MKPFLKCALGMVLVAFLAWVLFMHSGIRSPDAELARIARDALHMARDAQLQADSARRVTTALRILALAAGIAAPLVVAYLVHRLHARSEARPEEILQVLNGQKLIDWTHRPRELESEGQKQLPASGDSDGQEELQ